MKVFINPDFLSEFNPETDIQYWKINNPEFNYREPERITVTKDGYGYSIVLDEAGFYLEITNVDKNEQTYEVLKVIPLSRPNRGLDIDTSALN